jgi:5-formyltetrahydrofolate cyclo-ligase
MTSNPVDLVVAGCVAVSDDGARLGKGGGFSDLELAIATAAGLVDDSTAVVTTVHEHQLVARGRIPMSSHDIRLDYIATPDRVIAVDHPGERARPRIQWDELTDEKVQAIPLLPSLRREQRG